MEQNGKPPAAVTQLSIIMTYEYGDYDAEVLHAYVPKWVPTALLYLYSSSTHGSPEHTHVPFPEDTNENALEKSHKPEAKRPNFSLVMN